MKLPLCANSLLLLVGLIGTSAFTTPVQKGSLLTPSATRTVQWAKETDAVETGEATKAVSTKEETKDEEEEESEVSKLFQQIKESGTAGAISLGLWEGAFWLVSIPVAVLGFQQVTGHMPDFSNQEDMGKLGAEAFAFVNFARFAVPLRVGLALGTTPWVQENIVEKFLNKDEEEAKEEELEVVMDFSAEEETTEEAAPEPEAVEEEAPPKRRGLRRLVPGLLRRKD